MVWLSRGRWGPAICAVMVASCARHGASGAASLPRLPDPGYIDHSFTRSGDLVSHRAVAPGDPRVRLARALGVPVLRNAGLPPDVRELRIIDVLVAADMPFVRLLVTAGGVTGQAGALTTAVTDSSAADVSCSADPSVRGCVRLEKLPSGMDWPSLAARLDSLGVWSGEVECRFATPPDSATMWQSELSLERLEGERRSTAGCSSPLQREGAARKIFELLVDVTRLDGVIP